MVLALSYAIVAPALQGAPRLRGALYGLAPWLLTQVAVLPMMGMPVFSGSFVLAAGSLLGHLVYGAVLGSIYGEESRAEARRPTVA